MAKLVVRYNGGAQAGHNVVTPDGRHHCFSQWGSGTFVGAPTLLSRHMMVNPITAMSEARHLREVGVGGPLALLRVEAGALVTTQFHMAANRLREMARGRGVHGSCGMGVGETQQDFLAGAPDVIRAEEMWGDTSKLAKKLDLCRARKLAEVGDLPFDRSSPAVKQELELLHDASDVAMEYYAAFAADAKLVDDQWLARELHGPGDIVFEGAQGVLLDQDWGFHPHTTWSACTFANALALVGDAAASVKKIGVLRVYHTRHGAGPFPTESTKYDALSAGDHNGQHPWQHSFRSGAFDLVLARYALDVVGGCDGLVFTHLDKLENTDKVFVGRAYNQPSKLRTELLAKYPDRLELRTSFMERLPLGSAPPSIPDLGYQEDLGRLLAASRVFGTQVPLSGDPMRHALWLGDQLRTPVVMVSTGPTGSPFHRSFVMGEPSARGSLGSDDSPLFPSP